MSKGPSKTTPPPPFPPLYCTPLRHAYCRPVCHSATTPQAGRECKCRIALGTNFLAKRDRRTTLSILMARGQPRWRPSCTTQSQYCASMAGECPPRYRQRHWRPMPFIDASIVDVFRCPIGNRGNSVIATIAALNGAPATRLPHGIAIPFCRAAASRRSSLPVCKMSSLILPTARAAASLTASLVRRAYRAVVWIWA